MKGMAIDEETPMEYAETAENLENGDNMTQNRTQIGGAEPKSGKKDKKRSSILFNTGTTELNLELKNAASVVLTENSVWREEITLHYSQQELAQ